MEWQTQIAVASPGISSKPLVSVITPVFNGASFLELCLQSVLAQDYPHVEHILVDGGSMDGTLNILRDYSSRYPGRIRFISEPDRGGEDGMNKGFMLSRGEILGFFLGSDDTYLPDAIGTVVSFFQAHPKARCVFGEADVVNESGDLLYPFVTRDFDFEEAINDGVYVPAPAVFFTREVLETVGLMNIDILPSDFEYIIRVGKVFPIHRLRRKLADFRLHSGCISGSPGVARKYQRAAFLYGRRHGARFFSLVTRRYAKVLVADLFRPLLGAFYPAIKRLIRTTIPAMQGISKGSGPERENHSAHGHDRS
jgi:glycosyltransferase involved in cell wall biosynthesis